jgi:hypothetical protein
MAGWGRSWTVVGAGEVAEVGGMLCDVTRWGGVRLTRSTWTLEVKVSKIMEERVGFSRGGWVYLCGLCSGQRRPAQIMPSLTLATPKNNLWLSPPETLSWATPTFHVQTAMSIIEKKNCHVGYLKEKRGNAT